VSVADGSVTQITNQTWRAVGGFAWAGDSGALVVAAAQRGEVFQLWRLPFPDGEPQRITNDVSTYTSVSLSADSSVLAAVQTNVVQNLWTATAITSGGAAAAPVQLTFGAGRYDGSRGVAWAPDGRLAYHSLAGGGDDIWIINADGTGQRQLTDGRGTYTYPRVSPDGRYLLYSASEHASAPGVWRMNLDGSGAKLLIPRGSLFSVSPDSRWVLCYRHGPPVTVLRVPLEGGEPERVRLPDGAQAATPYISPDGRLVAYNYRAAEPSAQWHIAIFPFEGGDAPSKVFPVVGSPVRQLRWTPDGRAVCHIEPRQNVSNVVCLPLDGGPAFPVTDFKSEFIDAFDFSPDGRRLALSRASYTSGVVLLRDER
jgi:Tol biopolymer transport system component